MTVTAGEAALSVERGNGDESVHRSDLDASHIAPAEQSQPTVNASEQRAATPFVPEPGRGAWMLTFTGRLFYLQAPDPHDIDLRDIAHHLAQICRFGGATCERYSVAQHSTMVSRIAQRLVPPELQLEAAIAGQLHDAAEAYTGDVIAPLKALLPDFGRIERRIEEAVIRRFALPFPWSSEPSNVIITDAVKKADRIAFATEWRDLISDKGAMVFTKLPEPEPATIMPLDDATAEHEFLQRATVLLDRRASHQ